MVVASEALFRESAPGVHTRKLAGNEAMCTVASEGDGLTHATYSASVKLRGEVSASDLREKVTRAMIRFRHLLPAIGCKVSNLPPKQEFQFTYEVPKTLDDALNWARSVVIFYDDPLGLVDAHDKIRKTVWWKGSAGRYTHELHVHQDVKDSSRWTFSLSVHHSNADGRSSLMCLDKICIFLEGEILGRAAALEDLKWGEETCRLPVPPESIPSIAEKGAVDDFPSVGTDFMPAPPEGYAPFLYPFQAVDGADENTITSKLTLTKEETRSFHKACKERHRTITQAATALGCLANVEWILKISGENDSMYENTVKLFEGANVFQTSINSADIRYLLPESYRTFDSEHTTPLNCVDGFPFAFPFEPYKEMLSLDKQQRNVTHAGDKATFWDKVVKDVADAWSKQERTVEAFRTRAAVLNQLAMNPNIAMDPFINVAPIFSSFGDLTRLNILERFRPSAGNEALVVEELRYTNRINTPALAFCFMEYDGELSIIVFTCGKYWTMSQLETFITLLKSWMDDILLV